MNLDDLNKKFEKFKREFIELKKKSDGLASVNENLRQEITRLKAEIHDNQATLKGFQNQTKIDKIVNELESEEGKKIELKRLLDQYIEEIDGCIEILKNA